MQFVKVENGTRNSKTIILALLAAVLVVVSAVAAISRGETITTDTLSQAEGLAPVIADLAQQGWQLLMAMAVVFLRKGMNTSRSK